MKNLSAYFFLLCFPVVAHAYRDVYMVDEGGGDLLFLLLFVLGVLALDRWDKWSKRREAYKKTLSPFNRKAEDQKDAERKVLVFWSTLIGAFVLIGYLT